MAIGFGEGEGKQERSGPIAGIWSENDIVVNIHNYIALSSQYKGLLTSNNIIISCAVVYYKI